MNIQIIDYKEPQVNYGEISRYLGMKGLISDNRFDDVNNSQSADNLQVLKLVNECLREALPKLKYRVCYRELNSIEMKEAGCFDLDYLKNARSLVIFGATIGIEIDRLINKYSRMSVTKAAIFEAIGNERIESLCDAFNDDVDAMAFDNGLITKNRISPGYGKFELDSQVTMFSLLELPRRCGIFLNDSLLMSPSKSVTAVISIFDEYEKIVEDIREAVSTKGMEDIDDIREATNIKDVDAFFDGKCSKREEEKKYSNVTNRCKSCDKDDCQFRG